MARSCDERELCIETRGYSHAIVRAEFVLPSLAEALPKLLPSYEKGCGMCVNRLSDSVYFLNLTFPCLCQG